MIQNPIIVIHLMSMRMTRLAVAVKMAKTRRSLFELLDPFETNLCRDV